MLETKVPSEVGRILTKLRADCLCVQLNADLKSVDEDKDRVFAKLNDEVKAKEDLLGEFDSHVWKVENAVG